ncbi:SusF/SusE family outer membrane protein [Croceivirga sp. JEA036]|uniref:SusF/SusE family outer membrane protein n=1 Tax=Croceivirga sp. JEA036 TaxID=2721162 RepID=UPI00143B891F|nr:SusF/SusE family outer membrane protein [Croceivirga sp. JEA036]NJB37679.1 SusF/SusE family outer membrane protein [Croceivirga sp. JEA036]
MKKNLAFIYASIVAMALLVTGCSDDDENIRVSSEANTQLTLSSTDALELTRDMTGETVLSLNWTAPDFGFTGAVPTYNVVVGVDAATEAMPARVNVGNVLSKDFLAEELNDAVADAGALAGLENEVKIWVEAMLGKDVVASSAAQVLTITGYATTFDLSSPWGLVGSATPNGWDGPDVPVYSTAIANEFVAYVTLVDGELKIRENNDWTVNYGDTGADGTLDLNGDNIQVTAGTYKVMFSLNDFSYSIEPFTWGLVGDATPNGWDGPDTPLTYDSSSDQWRTVVTLTDGEMKFRQNNDWAVNFGDTGADGTIEANGDNIMVEAGNYLVSVDFTNNLYTLEPIDIWGLVGDAAPNGWDGPNVRFTPDYANEGVWILENVTLLDGEIKFRTNDAWDFNYGDDGNDGTLETDGANIPVSAGTYTITLYLADADNPTYTIE